MKSIAIVILGLLLLVPCAAPSDDREAGVRTTVQAFYKAFDDGFVGPADYAAEDWNHIGPYVVAIEAGKQPLRTCADCIKPS